MTDFIIIAVLVLVIGCASYYIYKSKKQGNKCIGCPYSGTCGNPKDNTSSCCSNCESKK